MYIYSVLYILNVRSTVIATQQLCETDDCVKNTVLTFESNLKITRNLIGKSFYTAGKAIETAFQITIYYWIKLIFHEDIIISNNLVS